MQYLQHSLLYNAIYVFLFLLPKEILKNGYLIAEEIILEGDEAKTKKRYRRDAGKTEEVTK